MKNGVLLTATLLGSLLISAQAVAGASANIGATSNYIWRGVTQTQDAGAVQAGIDYKAENGLYAGAWSSNVKFGGVAGTELDVYAGYSKELASGLSYDVGAIQYKYFPDASFQDFSEVYGKVGYKGFNAEVDYTVDKENLPGVTAKEKDVYYAVGYKGKLANDWGYGVTAGKYDFDDPAGDDYSHTQLSLTKTVGKAGDFTLAVDKPSGLLTTTDTKANSTKVSLSWEKSFDF
ncbi:TorF family putative porin [Thiothrix unzii]|jgi:uncharacterized protein (TIGR02001 family)|uniref:TorF family putative porin n=1 Tax=Thiothrix unzii TaxID=111769 RepID=UPI002A36997B|nr:TorF family putative porin [Thiothrix unzii]MDX9989211.1 TorF family putative porin [Thiothrix unzii]